MSAILIFFVLPVGLIVLSFFVRPLVRRGRGEQTAFNQIQAGAASSVFGGHHLQPDPVSMPEETERVVFDLGRIKSRQD